MSKKREYLIRKAANHVRWKLKRRKGIFDLTKPRPSNIAPEKLFTAKGFILRIRGIGRVIIVKPDIVASWVHGPVGPTEVIKDLNRRGRLIRGSDGKLTRQVKIPGLGRQRYYCFIIRSDQGVEIPRWRMKKALNGSDDDYRGISRGLREAANNARDSEGVRAMLAAKEKYDDDDISDWDESDDSDPRGIAAVSTFGRGIRTIQDYKTRKDGERW